MGLSGPSQADLVVIGAGIVGLAAAEAYLRRMPRRGVIVLEKEGAIAQHQTGHNSGVLHSGIYYKPGSLKAVNCRRGKAMMEAFCRDEGVPIEICGKVIVAVDERELPALEMILKRGLDNGVRCEAIGRERLRELEPAAAGIRGIHVPETGIVDFPAVCDRLAARIRDAGGEVVTGAPVVGIAEREDGVVVEAGAGCFRSRLAANCAGLHVDRVAAMAGATPPARIVPFRGEYYELAPGAQHLCRNLIYPVPDPAFPFLGVHFTRMIRGGVECGPNAVLALAREGYRWSDVEPEDVAEIVGRRAFWRMARAHWRAGAAEMLRSASKFAFVRALRHLVPAIRAQDLRPASAGVRAQAVGPNGKLLDDFAIVQSRRMVHVINAPSPAATSALSIGESIVDRLAGLG